MPEEKDAELQRLGEDEAIAIIAGAWAAANGRATATAADHTIAERIRAHYR